MNLIHLLLDRVQRGAVMKIVVLSQCEGVLMSRLESPLGTENGLVEPSLETHASRMTLYGQVPGPIPSESTDEGPECYPLQPEAHESITVPHC
jgi:hypothetical protein